MDLKHLKELHAARPFRPFILYLADGRSKRVRHPESMAFLGNGRTIFFSDSGTDGYEFIDLILIISAEVTASSGGEGRRRKSA